MGSDPDPETGRGHEPPALQVDRPAPTIGVLLAGVALFGATLDWPSTVPAVAGVAVVPAVGGVVAVVAFVARRHGLLDRRTGPALAAVASVAVFGYAVYAFWTAVRGPPPDAVGAGVPVAVAGAVASAAIAYVDSLDLPAERVLAGGKQLLLSVAVGLGGFVNIIAWQSVLVLPVLGLGLALSGTLETLIGTLALGLGTASMAWLYLQMSDRDLSFFDLDRPSPLDVGYALGGVVALFATMIGLQFLFTQLGVTGAEHSLVQRAQDNSEILLVLIPASWLIVGPGEELLFRNTVQKSLYEQFPRWAAVPLASLPFAAVHYSAYAGGTPLQTLQSLLLVFALSLILGGVYARTDNVLVPAFVHGTFNGVQFALLYATLEGWDLPLSSLTVLA